jgi:hypothetical protein
MPPFPLGMQLYCTLPTVQFTGVVARDALDEVQSPGPRTRNSPMWLTSNTPTALRTAKVLIDHASVLHRHEVSGKRNQFGT